MSYKTMKYSFNTKLVSLLCTVWPCYASNPSLCQCFPVYPPCFSSEELEGPDCTAQCWNIGAVSLEFGGQEA